MLVKDMALEEILELMHGVAIEYNPEHRGYVLQQANGPHGDEISDPPFPDAWWFKTLTKPSGVYGVCYEEADSTCDIESSALTEQERWGDARRYYSYLNYARECAKKASDAFGVGVSVVNVMQPRFKVTLFFDTATDQDLACRLRALNDAYAASQAPLQAEPGKHSGNPADDGSTKAARRHVRLVHPRVRD